MKVKTARFRSEKVFQRILTVTVLKKFQAEYLTKPLLMKLQKQRLIHQEKKPKVHITTIITTITATAVQAKMKIKKVTAKAVITTITATAVQARVKLILETKRKSKRMKA